MPLTHETVLFDVHDAYVFELTADAVGGTATYSAGIDVPGIAEVGLDPNFITAELKGDGGKVLAKKGKVDRMNFTATYGKLALDVIRVFLGGTITDTGTTPNQEAQYRMVGANRLRYFGLQVSLEDVELGLGQVVVTLPKCQVTGGTLLGQSTENFGQPSFTAEAIARESDDIMAAIDFRETLVALSGTFPSLAAA